MLPLEGIKVLDLGSVLMAPYAAQWLADLGADVVKVETPAGDSTRRTGPTPEAGMAAIFLGTNRNKRSIVLDLRDPAGLAALLRLVDGADVFLHNIRPQKLAKLGIAPEVLMARNPRLIYAGLHGFGQDGPYGGQPAYDDIIQGMCGNADLMQRQIGQPKYFSTVSADKTSGLVAAIGILAALAGRERSGVGGFVEIPMFETMVAFNLVEHLYGAHFEPPLGPTGYPRALAVARGPFRTADGYISMMPYTDRHWIDFFGEVGAEDMLVDPLFIDIAARTSNIDLLYERLAAILLTRSSGEWLELCTRLEVPAAPVLKIDDLVHDEHLQETGFFEHLSDPRLGALLFPGVPLKFDGVRPGVRVPPRLGEHTREVLEEAGFAADEIAALLASGPVEQRPAAESRKPVAVAQPTL